MRVSIAGAGLLGRLIGWQLTLRGAQVTLFERDPPDASASAAYAAAAMVAPYGELPDAPAELLPLARRSLELWPEWLAALGIEWHADGSLVVAHARDRHLLRQFERILDERAPGAAMRVQPSNYEPELAARFPSAVYLNDEGWIDNRALLDALGSRCGTIEYGQAVEPHQLTDADLVLDCRGAAAAEPGLRAVRGEVIRVRAPDVALSRPIRLMHPRYQIYIVPRRHHHYVIGATQIENDRDGPVTVRSALELLSAAFSLHPGFAEAEILELGAGLRPAFPDNLPKVTWRDGILRVNGLYRHGYLVGPAVVESVIQEVLQQWKSPSTASPTSSTIAAP
jgi:glycine oxidase